MAAIKEWRRDYIHDTALPSKFVEEFAKVTSHAIMAWRSAKTETPSNILHLSLIGSSPYAEKADLLGYKDHPYDALLDQYEPDVKTKEVSFLFSKLWQL